MATSKGTVVIDIASKVKYSPLETREDKSKDGHSIDVSEKMPLLDDMETIYISGPHDPPQNKTGNADQDATLSPTGTSTAPTSNVSGAEPANTPTDNKGKPGDINADHNDRVGGSSSDENDPMMRHPKYIAEDPKPCESKVKAQDTAANDTTQSAQAEKDCDKKDSVADGGDGTDCPNLDIVRKMSEPASQGYVQWREIGSYSQLKLKSCQRIYAVSGRQDDLALFFVNGKFHAMEAWCSHMGGPLFDGDIEDYNGRCHVMCPWHSYMFDLETGANEIGLRQNVYDLKLENGNIFVRYKSALSLKPLRKPSEAQGPGVGHPPNKKNPDKQPVRKDSVLETVMRL